MRVCFSALITLCLIGCNNSSATTSTETTTSVGGDSGDSQGQAGNGSGEVGSGEMAPPIQIASGSPTLVGVTSDGWTVFRDGDALKASKLSQDAQVQDVAAKAGSVLIRGGAVFNWADMDWMANTGDLSIWTASGGTHEIGITPYVESLVAASDDGSAIVYPQNATATAADLMMADASFASPTPLLQGMGLASEKTCGAHLGFVGQAFLIGWCKPKSLNASLWRFDMGKDGWQGVTIADSTLPSWSADSTATNVFYQSSDYNGVVSANGTTTMIDVGVSQGQITPDGATVLYTVGDQLRRADLAQIKPTPIVTTGYKQPVQFSAGFDFALYSTTVTYDNGTQRDLLLVSTDGFHQTPTVLVSDPTATLGRSAMTRDGKYVAYLTGMTPSGGTLHVVDTDGNEKLKRPHVVEVAAGLGSTLIFTDNASDPNVYPVVADLNIVDLAVSSKPTLVEASVLDSKNFQVDADGTSVAYVRSGVGRDMEAPDHAGLFYRTMLR